jgi:hypothetical protein
VQVFTSLQPMDAQALPKETLALFTQDTMTSLARCDVCRAHRGPALETVRYRFAPSTAALAIRCSRNLTASCTSATVATAHWYGCTEGHAQVPSHAQVLAHNAAEEATLLELIERGATGRAGCANSPSSLSQGTRMVFGTCALSEAKSCDRWNRT